VTPYREEVLFAIAKCREKKLLEEDVVSTGTLTKELNSNQSRSRDWDPFEVGIHMAELGFAMSVTPTTHQRGLASEGKAGYNWLVSTIVCGRL
jgi:hypothetical protein